MLAMCERNYKVWCALNDVSTDGGEKVDAQDRDTDMSGAMSAFPEEDEEEWNAANMDMDEDDPPETGSTTRTTKVAEVVREKIRKVLEVSTGLADKRAGQCDQGDFLKLLYAFNQEGIHFA